jgi:CubicO group peptidase (beta-lactamase class C family)
MLHVRFALFALILLHHGPAEAARAVSRPPDPEAIDAIVNDALKAWNVPGLAMAIVHRGKVYLKGCGLKELGTRLKVTPRTVFPLASCSKAFTTTAIAMLVDEGKLQWDEPARLHIPHFRLADPLADANVTLRDLVSMRTGVDGHDLLWYRSKWPQEEIIRRIGRVKPTKSFRSGYRYQSIMVMAAGHAVGTASGSRWQDFVENRIFKALDFRDASLTSEAALKAPDHACGHRKNKLGQVEVVPWYPMPVPDPAGSVNASATDLSEWLLFHLGEGVYRGKRLVSAAALAETHSPQTIMRLEGSGRAFQPFTHQMSYGMGWVVQDYRGQHLLAHGGAIDGFRAHVTLVPEAELGIVLLNNLEGTQMNLAISNSLVDLFLDLRTDDWNTRFLKIVAKEEELGKEARKQRLATKRHGTKPSLDLPAYVGRYENPAYGVTSIALKNGKLTWSWSTFHGPVDHFHYDTFTASHDFLGDPLMLFRLDARGQVADMRFLDMDFKKTKS